MKTKLAYCPNCDHELKNQENYCPNCGQENNSRKVSFKVLLGDFFSNYFSLDSKLIKSLIPLVTKPGFLALEFVNGKRANYIPPLRMYFVISVVFFFVLSITTNKDSFEVNMANESTFSFNTNDTIVTYDNYEVFLDEVERSGIDSYMDSLNVETWVERFMITQTYHVIKNKGVGLQQRIFKNSSYVMFLLMPLFALFLKLFFRRNKLYYVEHLVHSLYIHAFIFLLQIVLALLSYFMEWFDLGLILLCSTVLISTYSYFSLKKVYEYRFWGTLWRMIVMIPIYNLFLAVGISLAFGLSIVTY